MSPQELLPWITTFVVAVIGAVSAAMMKARGKAEGKRELQETRTSIDGQPVGIDVVDKPATENDLKEMETRIEERISKLEEALNGERGIARTANGNVHKRIDALSERLGDRLSKLEGTTESINETVGKLLDIALNKKPGTR